MFYYRVYKQIIIIIIPPLTFPCLLLSSSFHSHFPVIFPSPRVLFPIFENSLDSPPLKVFEISGWIIFVYTTWRAARTYKERRLQTRLGEERWIVAGELRDNCVQRNSLAVMLEMTPQRGVHRRKFDRNKEKGMILKLRGKDRWIIFISLFKKHVNLFETMEEEYVIEGGNIIGGTRMGKNMEEKAWLQRNECT